MAEPKDNGTLKKILRHIIAQVSATVPLFPSPVLSLAFCTVIVLPFAQASEVIEFPEDELASETVLPIFDQPTTVRNRNIEGDHRFEFGLTGGLSLLEPFYNPYSIGVQTAYQFSELHGVDILGLFFTQGLSANGAGLNPIPRTSNNANLQYAPAPQYLVLADYRYTGFYGKMSVSKEFVMHLDLYGLIGGGGIAVGDGMFPVANLGLGQKLYFSDHFALKLDFRFSAYQGPDVLSRPLYAVTTMQPSSSFATKIVYLSLLNIGAVYVF